MIAARAVRLIAASLIALLLVMQTHPGFAAPLLQEAAANNDRTKVIVWTLAAVGGVMILLAIGYFYRRAAGIDKPPPVTILEPGTHITGD